MSIMGEPFVILINNAKRCTPQSIIRKKCCCNLANEANRRIIHVPVGASIIDTKSNYTIIRQIELGIWGAHGGGECSESHNWDLMVRGRSLIDPCWSALNRTVNRGLLTMQHSHARMHCKWRWQQPLCRSCCQLWLWWDDGDGLVSLGTQFF